VSSAIVIVSSPSAWVGDGTPLTGASRLSRSTVLSEGEGVRVLAELVERDLETALAADRRWETHELSGYGTTKCPDFRAFRSQRRQDSNLRHSDYEAYQ
jgi:hypothetical protein